MKEIFMEIFYNKIVDIFFVVVIFWIGVFIINWLVQLFFKWMDFIEERKEKIIESFICFVIQYIVMIGFIFYVIFLFVYDFGKILVGVGVVGIVIGFGV